MSTADPVLTPLPTEVLLHIAADLDKPDLARLLRINSFFHHVFIKPLYAHVPLVVIKQGKTEDRHCRPHLASPVYAQHVRSIDVPIFPFPCCRVLPDLPILPSLSVINLTDVPHGEINPLGMCGYPTTLRAKSVVIRYPFIYKAAEQFPTSLLLNEGTQLVVLLGSAGPSGGNSQRLPTFGRLLDILDLEIPDCIRLTFVLAPSTDPDWKQTAVSTLIRAFDHLGYHTDFVSTQLHSLTFVLGDVAFAASSRDVILAEVRKTHREMIAFDKVIKLLENGGIDSETSSEETASKCCDINILLLDEFLNSKDYGPVISTEDAAEWLRDSFQWQHLDTGADIDDVISRARDASADHISRVLDGEDDGAYAGNDSDDWTEVEDE